MPAVASGESLSGFSTRLGLGTHLSLGRIVGRLAACSASGQSFALARARTCERRSIRAECVSHHVASDVRRCELHAQAVERRTAIVGDGNNVALCHAHAG